MRNCLFVLIIACSEEKEDTVIVEEEEEIKRNYVTQNHFGSATVVPEESFEGTEYYQFARNSMTGLGVAVIDLIWTTSGVPEPAPEICVDCVFAFDVQFTFDQEASTDLDNQGYDMNFSYALGSSEYGENTLFYGYNGSWGVWIADERVQVDDEGTEHLEEVSLSGSEFSYTDGLIDFYEMD